MILTSQKTLEFLFPSIVPNSWFADLSRVWNEGLFILKWLEHQNNLKRLSLVENIFLGEQNEDSAKNAGFIQKWIEHRGSPDKLTSLVNPRLEIRFKKIDGKWVPYQPLFVERRIDRAKSWEKSNIEQISVFDLPDDRSPWVNPIWLDPCPIEAASAIDLCKPFAGKRCQWLKESDIPAFLVSDFIRLTLIPAWEAYKKGQRGKPRYKKPGEVINTIPSASFRGQCDYLGDDWIRIPKLGKVQINGLDLRLMHPIERLVDAMRADPNGFPAIDRKIGKYVIADRSKLMKADGIDIKAIRKEQGAEKAKQIADEFAEKIDRSQYMSQVIEHFSSPGGFRLIRREGKTYIQFSAEMPETATPSTKAVGVDTGSSLLIHATNGLIVKHQPFEKEERRLLGLDRAISRCVVKSNAWEKLNEKKRRLKRIMARSRKCRQAFYAQQLTDVNGAIALKKIKIKPAIGTPVPIPTKTGYAPNGAMVARGENRAILDCATGQFILILEQQAKKRGRTFEKVEIEVEATAAEVLEESSISVDSSPPIDLADFFSPCDPPEPTQFKKRDRKRERRIG